MAYTYNPSYSGGKDWEDHSSKPARAKKLGNPISKNPSHTKKKKKKRLGKSYKKLWLKAARKLQPD
jgi:hypothetical protein